MLLFATVGLPAGAQSAIPLTLAEAEDKALDQEPGRSALEARADALAEEAVAAGQLPDPKLRVGIANYPVESGGFTTEGMTQAQLGLHQSFPPGDTRSLSTRRLRLLAGEVDKQAEGRGRDVLTAVRDAWLEGYYWYRAETIVRESRPFFKDLVTVTKSLYAVGRDDQQDVLRAKLELSRLDDRLIDIDRNQDRSRAALSQWIGDDARRPLAEKLPHWVSVPPLEALRDALRSHPRLEAADALVEARSTGIDLAMQRYKPGWAVDFGYGHREGRLPGGEPRSDFISLSVTIDLPLFRHNRQDRYVRAAVHERRAAIDSKERVLRELESELETEFTRWHDLSRRLTLYEQEILPQSEEQAKAALAAYQSDAGDFAEVMRAYVDLLNTRLDVTRLRIDRARSYAILANLGGLPR